MHEGRGTRRLQFKDSHRFLGFQRVHLGSCFYRFVDVGGKRGPLASMERLWWGGACYRPPRGVIGSYLYTKILLRFRHDFATIL